MNPRPLTMQLEGGPPLPSSVEVTWEVRRVRTETRHFPASLDGPRLQDDQIRIRLVEQQLREESLEMIVCGPCSPRRVR